YTDRLPKEELRKIVTGDKRVQGLAISPDGRFVTYRLFKSAGQRKGTIIPDYVTESGFTTDISGRTKVGETHGTSEFYVYDRNADTIYSVKTDSIEGIRDLPDYINDYPKQKEIAQKKNAAREVNFGITSWSPNGENLVLEIRSQDNKDRWLMRWDKLKNKLELLDRQRNEAWIGGPGSRSHGWINENNFWYQSEVSGYSHLYSVDVHNGQKKTYPSGNYEVQQAQLTNDKKYFYITTNKVHPGEKHFYRLRIAD